MELIESLIAYNRPAPGHFDEPFMDSQQNTKEKKFRFFLIESPTNS